VNGVHQVLYSVSKVITSVLIAPAVGVLLTSLIAKCLEFSPERFIDVMLGHCSVDWILLDYRSVLLVFQSCLFWFMKGNTLLFYALFYIKDYTFRPLSRRLQLSLKYNGFWSRPMSSLYDFNAVLLCNWRFWYAFTSACL